MFVEFEFYDSVKLEKSDFAITLKAAKSESYLTTSTFR